MVNIFLTNGSVVSPWVVGAVTGRDVEWTVGEVALSCGEVAMTDGEVALSRGEVALCRVEVGMTGGERLHYIKLGLFVSYISEVIFLKIMIQCAF